MSNIPDDTRASVINPINGEFSKRHIAKRDTFTITLQPDDATCGPACLHALYRYWNVDLPLEQVISEVASVPNGGTFAVNLALHAMERGFNSTIYTSNLQLFDPTWFNVGGRDLKEGLAEQMKSKEDPKLQLASQSYLEYLERGGIIRMEDISFDLISAILLADCPLIVGLSCTWLYRCVRETADHGPDDVRGESTGHFVVVYDVDRENRQFLVADPYGDHPFSDEHCYSIGAARLIGAIMLGIVTYDAKLLLLTPA